VDLLWRNVRQDTDLDDPVFLATSYPSGLLTDSPPDDGHLEAVASFVEAHWHGADMDFAISLIPEYGNGTWFRFHCSYPTFILDWSPHFWATPRLTTGFGLYHDRFAVEVRD